MGNVHPSVCREILDYANFDYWVYFAFSLGVLAFLFVILPILLIIAYATRNIPLIQIPSKILMFIVRFFDLNANTYPTAIHVTPTYDEGGVIDTDDILQVQSLLKKPSSNKKKKKEQLDNAYKIIPMKEVSRLLGGYFTILLMVVSIVAIFFICYTQLSLLLPDPVVHPSSVNTDTLNGVIDVQVNIPCNVDGGNDCSDLSASVVDARNGTEHSYPLPMFSCYQYSDICQIKGVVPVNTSNHFYLNFEKPITVKVQGHRTDAISEPIPIKLKSWINGVYNNFATGDSVYYFSDTCRNADLSQSSSNAQVNIYTSFRRKCDKLFGVMNTCGETALSFSSFEQQYIPSTQSAGTIFLNFYISPTVMDTIITLPASIYIFVVCLIFVIAVLTLQPILKKFASKIVVSFVRRRLTGQGVGILKALMMAIFTAIYLAISFIVLLLFITAVLLDYQVRLPAYALATESFWSIVLGNSVAGVVLAVAWLAICATLVVVFIFYLGLDSSSVKKKQEEMAKLKAQLELDEEESGFQHAKVEIPSIDMSAVAMGPTTSHTGTTPKSGGGSGTNLKKRMMAMNDIEMQSPTRPISGPNIIPPTSPDLESTTSSAPLIQSPGSSSSAPISYPNSPLLLTNKRLLTLVNEDGTDNAPRGRGDSSASDISQGEAPLLDRK